MANIYAVLRAKRAELERLKEDVAALERAVAVLERTDGGQEAAGVPALGLGRRMRQTSSTALAIAVLRDARKHMHADALVDAIKQRGAEVKKSSLVSSLAKLAKERTMFCRGSAPNTFGLIEWNQSGSSATATANGTSEPRDA